MKLAHDVFFFFFLISQNRFYSLSLLFLSPAPSLSHRILHTLVSYHLVSDKKPGSSFA